MNLYEVQLFSGIKFKPNLHVADLKALWVRLCQPSWLMNSWVGKDGWVLIKISIQWPGCKTFLCLNAVVSTIYFWISLFWTKHKVNIQPLSQKLSSSKLGNSGAEGCSIANTWWKGMCCIHHMFLFYFQSFLTLKVPLSCLLVYIFVINSSHELSRKD